MTKLKTLIVIFGLLSIIVRLFYFQLDRLVGVKILDGLIILLIISSLTLLVLTIIKLTRIDFKPFLILILIFGTLIFIPFEYLIGWTKFNFNRNERNELVNKLKDGTFEAYKAKKGTLNMGLGLKVII
jgi:hypothetical protein